MANVKQVHFHARVPFDWASNLTAQEAKCWAAWVLAPSTGLTLEQDRASYEDVPETGGRCAMYELNLYGEEAIREGALAILADSLRKQRYAEVVAESRDLEYTENEPWYTVRTVRQQRAAEKRAKKQVEEMMRGKKWVTVEHGNGYSSAHLVDDPAAS